MTEIDLVESNLRSCFRALAADRQAAETRLFGGLDIASLGVRFQMFNAAFLAAPIPDPESLERRVVEAKVHFNARGLDWSFWLCDGLLSDDACQRARRICSRQRLALATEMPGMIATRLADPGRTLPACEIHPADSPLPLEHFRRIGSECFRVPAEWFREVFDERSAGRLPFRGWVAYADGQPVATTATVVTSRSIGLYNVATIPSYRSHGFAEALMRAVLAREVAAVGELPIVLQSTAEGRPLYERMGFRAVTTFRVWVS